MSTHEGVSCDNCLKSNFGGIRYKCLICYDFDLCETCHPFDSTSSPHLASHPMQCILTQTDFGLYYSGESITPDNPPAFVCPYCGKLGFTEALLQEHVLKEHANDRTEVVCPICAALPSGEPNLVSDDFGGHLQNEHRGQRDIDDPSSGRQMRRVLCPGRGMRSRNHRTMHFSGGPLASSNTAGATSAISSNNNSATSVASAARDMDPIAELLSQLSGVRRNAQILQQVVSSETHINEIQSKLQMERQRAAEIRQQLQRFPIKTQSQNGDVHASAGVAQNGMSSNNSKSGNSANKRATIHSPDEDSKRFLLNNLDELNTGDSENQSGTPEKALFVQELLLSLLNSPTHAIPVDAQQDDTASSSEMSSASASGSKKVNGTAAAVSKQTCGPVEQQVVGDRTTEKKPTTAETEKKTPAPSSATSPMPMSNGTTLTKEKKDINPSSPSPSSRSQKSAAAASAAVMSSSSSPVEKEVGNSAAAAAVVNEPPRNINDDRPPSPSSPAHHGRLYLGGGTTTTTSSSGPVRIDHRCASAANAAAEYNSGNTSVDQVSTGAAMKNNLR